MPTVLEVLRKATDWLSGRGSASPRLDAEVLLASGLGVRRIDLYLLFDRPLSEDEVGRLRALVAERGKGVPVAYLTGTREFFALPFEVTRDVLVPRPETEGLVEAALEALEGVEAPVVADVGTGTGCVLVSILHRTPAARGHATDASPSALEVARRNAARHAVADRATFHEGSWLAPLRALESWGRLSAVVSNPPYVVRGDPTLDAHVAAHEPALALYVDGDDPSAPARAIAEQALEALAPGGFLALEVGAGAAPRVAESLAALGYADVRSRRDLAGIERVVTARKPPDRTVS
jgi:release factor glutamine methyltransferase